MNINQIHLFSTILSIFLISLNFKLSISLLPIVIYNNYYNTSIKNLINVTFIFILINENVLQIIYILNNFLFKKYLSEAMKKNEEEQKSTYQDSYKPYWDNYSNPNIINKNYFDDKNISDWNNTQENKKYYKDQQEKNNKEFTKFTSDVIYEAGERIFEKLVNSKGTASKKKELSSEAFKGARDAAASSISGLPISDFMRMKRWFEKKK